MAKLKVAFKHFTPWDDFVHETGGNTECPCNPEVEDITSAEVGLIAKVFAHRRMTKLGDTIPDDVTLFAEVYLACDGCQGRVTGTKPKRMGSVNWPCLCPHGRHPVIVDHLAGYPASTAVPTESAARG